MGETAQFVINSQRLDRKKARSIVERLVRENKDIAQAVDTLAETKKTRRDAVLEVVKRNPSIQRAVARALLAARKK